MRTQNYTLQGGDVPAHLKGTVIRLKVAESVAEMTQLCGGNEGLAVSKFNDGYAIALQGVLRRRSGKTKDGQPTETPETLQAFADGYTLAERAEGTAREVKPETKANRVAADQSNKNFERALTDEQFRKQGIKFGFIDEDAFNAWKQARDEAAAAKAAATPTEATK